MFDANVRCECSMRVFDRMFDGMFQVFGKHCWKSPFPKKLKAAERGSLLLSSRCMPISEHADGECQGLGADAKVPTGSFWMQPPRDPSQPLGHNYVVMAYTVMADGCPSGSVAAPLP